jgi:hypothetical protein
VEASEASAGLKRLAGSHHYLSTTFIDHPNFGAGERLVNMSIAIYDPPPGGAAALAPNVSQKVIGIRLNTGNNLSPFWVNTGKVVVASASAVSVRAQLVAVAPPAPPTVLDTSTATIPANGF